MATARESGNGALRLAEAAGQGTLRGIEMIGYGATLFGQAVYWLFLGRRHGQVVRAAPVFREMMQLGIGAIPIITILTGAIGIVLAMQGITSLEAFGAEHQVVIMVALSVTREFGPLITGIIVAGRSGSALAARLGTMVINNEVDALRVMGINPVRFLVVPSLVAMMVMVPVLTIWADLVSLYGAGLYITSELGTTMTVYVNDTLSYLTVEDVMHGVNKSIIFAALITMIGVLNGYSVKGGAEGVGRVTTSSVVQAISAIVLTDLVFVFAATRS